MKNKIKMTIEDRAGLALRTAVRAYTIIQENCPSDDGGMYYASQAVVGRCDAMIRLGHDDCEETKEIWEGVMRGHGKVLGW